jgi:hypothetical protein
MGKAWTSHEKIKAAAPHVKIETVFNICTFPSIATSSGTPDRFF